MAEETRITCKCGASLKIPEGAMNMNVRCPKCGIEFVPSEKQIPDAFPEDENPKVDSAKSAKTIHKTRKTDLEEPVFSCPNPKCNFIGTVAAERENYGKPAIVFFVTLLMWGAWSFILVGLTFAPKDPDFIRIQMILMGILACFLILCTFAAAVVFAVRLGLFIIGRRFCPKCGYRLR